MYQVFPGISTLLARASAQGLTFRVNLGNKGFINPETYAFLGDHISPSHLNKADKDEVQCPFDGMQNAMQNLQTFLVVKGEEFQNILAYARNPIPGLAENLWLVRSILDSARSDFELGLLIKGISENNGDVLPKTNICSFPKKKVSKRRFNC